MYPDVVGIIFVNNTWCNLCFFYQTGIITKCCELPKLCDNFSGAWKYRSLYSKNIKSSVLNEELWHPVNICTLLLMGVYSKVTKHVTCSFQITVCDPIYLGIGLYALCLCEMSCYFQSAPFNKLALCRKASLIIPCMILICIKRKCPFGSLLKGGSFFPVHC